MNRMWACCLGGLLTCSAGNVTRAQFVSGDWVARSETSVQEHRTTPISFLVLDADGKLAPNATIHIEQLSHAFTVGFIAHDGFPETYDADAEGWRVFNAVSLEALTSWRQMQPSGPDAFSREAVDSVIERAGDAGLRLRWGAMVSADAFDLPEWVVPLREDALFIALRAYADRVAEAYGQAVADVDVAEETLDHDRLSPAMIRLLALDLRATWHTRPPRLRYEQAMLGSRTFGVVDAMDSVLKQRLGIEGFSVDQTFPPRPVAQDLLEPALKRLAKFGQPLTIASLEIGGTHAIETAVNTETVLRTLFAEPMVAGVYLSGLLAEDMSDPSAAVFDDRGEPTAVARTLDRLFREVWWTDVTLTSNELGQAQTRVYLGAHRVTATLPDGGTVTATVGLSDRQGIPREIVLMPVGSADD